MRSLVPAAVRDGLEIPFQRKVPLEGNSSRPFAAWNLASHLLLISVLVALRATLYALLIIIHYTDYKRIMFPFMGWKRSTLGFVVRDAKHPVSMLCITKYLMLLFLQAFFPLILLSHPVCSVHLHRMVTIQLERDNNCLVALKAIYQAMC